MENDFPLHLRQGQRRGLIPMEGISMKAAIVFCLTIGLLLTVLLTLPVRSSDQDNDRPGPAEKFTREELAQMLAPIALYPDVLLSQILMASTYPIEVIEADRWVRKNPELSGEDLDTALLDKDWAPSVKALCHFPEVLNLMSERITETTNIGNAFLVQREEVMDMIQELRAKAHAEGNLIPSPEQKVVVEEDSYIIEPADPRVIYVPSYDPFDVYGPWWYPDYPPYFWAPGGVRPGSGFSFRPGYYPVHPFGWSYFDWHNRHIFIDAHKRPRYIRRDRWHPRPGPWVHAPRHRRGVAYRDKRTARKYGQYPYSPRVFPPETRGFPAQPDSGGALQMPGRRTDRDRSVGAGFGEKLQPDGAELIRRMQERTKRERQEQAGMEQERRQREQAQRDRIEQLRPEIRQQLQQRGLMEQDRQIRLQSEQDRLQRQRIEQDRRLRQRIEQERRARQRLDLDQRERSRDNIFNRIDDAGMERRSSERGRSSRQGGGPVFPGSRRITPGTVGGGN